MPTAAAKMERNFCSITTKAFDSAAGHRRSQWLIFTWHDRSVASGAAASDYPEKEAQTGLRPEWVLLILPAGVRSVWQMSASANCEGKPGATSPHLRAAGDGG